MNLHTIQISQARQMLFFHNFVAVQNGHISTHHTCADIPGTLLIRSCVILLLFNIAISKKVYIEQLTF